MASFASNVALVASNVAEGDGGVAFFQDVSSAVITSSTFEFNRAGIDGGAILVEGNASVVVSSSIFTSNEAAIGEGGGIMVQEGARLMGSNTTFQGNFARNGAGHVLCQQLARAVFERSKFIEVLGGGGVSLQNNCEANFTECDFEANVAALQVEDFTFASLVGCKFTRNSADDGGAILMTDSAVVYIRDSTFFENTAGALGGAIYVDASLADIANSIFVGNAAEDFGGALVLQQFSTFSCSNCNFTANGVSAPGGNGGAVSASRTTATFQDSCVFQNNFATDGAAMRVLGGGGGDGEKTS